MRPIYEVVGVVQALWQVVALLSCLPLLSRLETVLVQTPPGVPTLPALALYCWLKGSRLVVDWHNYSHTILALALPPAHPLVRTTRLLEAAAGYTASAAFCVTQATLTSLTHDTAVASGPGHQKPTNDFVLILKWTSKVPLYQQLYRRWLLIYK